MPVTHEPWLVALSFLVAIQGAYVGLTLAVLVGGTAGVRQRLLLASAAFSLGVAIWSMHFVGMLAARLPFPVDFLVFPTLLSFLVCVIVVGTALFAASAVPLTPFRLGVSAIVMGCGIATMHYTGMLAWQSCAQLDYSAGYVATSIGIAIAASGLALWLASGRGDRLPLLLSATVLGLAISGMHYMAMAGTTAFPIAGSTPSAPALSSDLLAIVVAVVAFLVSGTFLLQLLPDRPTSDETLPGHKPGLATLSDQSDAAAAPGRRDDHPKPPQTARHLPVHRDGATHLIPIEDVVAIQANAHYTYIFDGTSKVFCPLPIGDIENRLDSGRFVRVHRSHIVNIERISAMRRAGDNGVIKLDGSVNYTVPVSRSRYGSLKSKLRPSEAHT